MKTKTKRFKLWLIAFISLIIIVPAVWILPFLLEGNAPSINFELESLSIRDSQELSVEVCDSKSGVKKIWIGLLKDGKEITLLKENVNGTALAWGERTLKKSFKFKIEQWKTGVSDGTAILRIATWDYSWRDWWRGNKAYLEKEIIIDTIPPNITILSKFHSIAQGGAALVIYKIFEPCQENGVHVEENFFPGHSGNFGDPNIMTAFFALSYKQGSKKTQIFVKAMDLAGNSSKKGLNCYIEPKKFKKDTLYISDRFLNWKMPEFDVKTSRDSTNPMLDKFFTVNNKLRQANYETAVSVGNDTDKTMHWSGAFLRLAGSATKAGFADHREYQYKNNIVDKQIHLGIDLASVARAPVQASNKGRIAFMDAIGIYGKTIFIDHGFGLFSMYSHLSSFNAQENQIVSKGEIIGRTGDTGLAGGDHLHFGILIHNTFVNPLEWLDASWIKNNITKKLDAVKSKSIGYSK